MEKEKKRKKEKQKRKEKKEEKRRKQNKTYGVRQNYRPLPSKKILATLFQTLQQCL